MVVEFAQKALEGYFGRDLSYVWVNTSVQFVDQKYVGQMCSSVDSTAVGCYSTWEYILIDKDRTDVEKCTIMVHEYIHAIGDQIFGDSDQKHTIYADAFFKFAPSICMKRQQEGAS